MTKAPDTLDDLLTALGGRNAVVDFLKCQHSAVSNWKTKGCIPPERILQLADMAAEKRLPVRLEDIRRVDALMPKPPKGENRPHTASVEAA